ncbi:MAG: TenA family transcriptional regulator [Bacteroidota bacterium]
MKNNRTIKLENEAIKKLQISTGPPPADSLFWTMWSACTDIAEEALNTHFVQGIKNGTLDPTIYGGFNVSDAYYCFHGADDYLSAANRATDETLKAFLLKKYNSYKSYNDTFPDTWHVKDASSIVPTAVCKEYSTFESSVAQSEDPIYSLVTMLPCEYLWAWLGAQLAPPATGNLYAPWINGNNDPSGAYAMGNFLNDYQQRHDIDEVKANELYKKAMNFEFQNFATATPGKKNG